MLKLSTCTIIYFSRSNSLLTHLFSLRVLWIRSSSVFSNYFCLDGCSLDEILYFGVLSGFTFLCFSTQLLIFFGPDRHICRLFDLKSRFFMIVTIIPSNNKALLSWSSNSTILSWFINTWIIVEVLSVSFLTLLKFFFVCLS